MATTQQSKTQRGKNKGGNKTDQNKGGRPTKYTRNLGARICELIVEGYSLRRICDEFPGMPDKSLLFKWLRERPEFLKAYRTAREVQADVFADDAIDESRKAVDKDSAAAANVRIQTIRWLTGVRRPEVYGNKVEISGDLTLSDRISKARERARQSGNE